MQIRRNTKTFKTILEIVTVCQTRPDRQSLVRLYITKAGRSIKDRISVEGSQGEAEFFYNLNFQAVLNNLQSSTHQLHQSDEVPGIYYFHSFSKEWDETPFEFDHVIKKEFSSLPELPVTRDKGAKQEFSIPVETRPTETGKLKKEKSKETVVVPKPTMFVSKGPAQPDYKLKRDIHFTDLDRVAFRQAKLNKRDVLDHYNRIADYLLPYLKDRPHLVRLQSDGGPNTAYANLETLPKKVVHEIQDWVEPGPDFGNHVSMFLCNDREHLLLYVELGCVEFDPCNSKVKSLTTPDYVVIAIESGSDFSKAVDVALTTKEVLDGLKLPSFLKTDGASGLHVYIPLDSKSKYPSSLGVAEYLCKLVRLKIPALVSLAGSDDNSYGKVVLDHLLNQEGAGIIAPYSFVAGGSGIIATPISWDEVNDELKPDEFNHNTIFDRIKKMGDPFEDLFSRKVNADALLDKLKEHYSFLV